jgi:hypothetical protein
MRSKDPENQRADAVGRIHGKGFDGIGVGVDEDEFVGDFSNVVDLIWMPVFGNDHGDEPGLDPGLPLMCSQTLILQPGSQLSAE